MAWAVGRRVSRSGGLSHSSRLRSSSSRGSVSSRPSYPYQLYQTHGIDRCRFDRDRQTRLLRFPYDDPLVRYRVDRILDTFYCSHSFHCPHLWGNNTSLTMEGYRLDGRIPSYLCLFAPSSNGASTHRVNNDEEPFRLSESSPVIIVSTMLFIDTKLMFKL